MPAQSLVWGNTYTPGSIKALASNRTAALPSAECSEGVCMRSSPLYITAVRSGDKLMMLPTGLQARMEPGTLYSQSYGLAKASPPDDEGQCFTGHFSIQEELQAFKEFLVLFLCLHLFPSIFLLCCHLLQRRGQASHH